MAEENTTDEASDAAQGAGGVPKETQGFQEGKTMSKGGLVNGHGNVDSHWGLKRLLRRTWRRKLLWSRLSKKWEARMGWRVAKS